MKDYLAYLVRNGLTNLDTNFSCPGRIPLSNDNLSEYKMGDLFTFVKGKRLTKHNMVPGKVNFLGAISENNGVREYIDTDNPYEPNCITVNYNGSVGESIYQFEPFWASDDVNVLYADKWELNKYIAMYVVTVIKQTVISSVTGASGRLRK